MTIFEKAKLGKVILKNRIIRSATYEGMCDENGFPRKDYEKMYTDLAKNEAGCMITGFAFISKEGRAMQPYQAGIDAMDKINHFKKITDAVHKHDGRIFMQIAHAGRQTLNSITENDVSGVTNKRSFYFKGKPRKLLLNEIFNIIEQFSDSAYYAKLSGFDGIQIHGAHGYLIHQFLLKSINYRSDMFGINKKSGLGIKFLDLLIDKIRVKCGKDYPVLIKISCSDDYFNKFTKTEYINLIKFLDFKKVDGIEISYGTMDYALNIFRGGIPVELILKLNPIYKTDSRYKKLFWKLFIYPLLKIKIKKFKPMYNLEYSKIAKKVTNIPIITVGGFRSYNEINYAIYNEHTDFVSLCRPFLCEPDFVLKLKQDITAVSKCINCNICAVMCDSINPTRCYKES